MVSAGESGREGVAGTMCGLFLQEFVNGFAKAAFKEVLVASERNLSDVFLF